MHENFNNMGSTILQLVRHKDATAEQMWAVHKQYQHAFESLVEARNKLRELYPRPHLWRDYPWNLMKL